MDLSLRAYAPAFEFFFHSLPQLVCVTAAQMHNYLLNFFCFRIPFIGRNSDRSICAANRALTNSFTYIISHSKSFSGISSFCKMETSPKSMSDSLGIGGGAGSGNSIGCSGSGGGGAVFTRNASRGGVDARKAGRVYTTSARGLTGLSPCGVAGATSQGAKFLNL
jgi:hypothetical protein